MKKIHSLSAPALLAACVLSLPLGAAVSGSGSVGGSTGASAGSSSGSSVGSSVGGSGAIGGAGSSIQGGSNSSINGSTNGAMHDSDPNGSLNGQETLNGGGALQSSPGGSIGTTSSNNSNSSVGAGADYEHDRNVKPSTTPGAQLTPRATPMGTPGATGRKLSSEYRGFSRRLRNVDQEIDQAVKDGRTSAGDAARQHQAVADVRSQFKTSASGSAKLSDTDKARLDAEVKAQEDSVSQASTK